MLLLKIYQVFEQTGRTTTPQIENRQTSVYWKKEFLWYYFYLYIKINLEIRSGEYFTKAEDTNLKIKFPYEITALRPITKWENRFIEALRVISALGFEWLVR